MDASAPRPVVRVAILVERRLYREAIASCLSADPHFTIVGQAASGADLLDLCELCPPDVVLLSVADGGPTVLNVLSDLRGRFATIRAIVVYEQLSAENFAAIWHAGVDNIVPASNGLDALRVVLRGHPAVVPPQRQPSSPPFPPTTAGPTTGRPPSRPNPAGMLTERELKILALLGGGNTVSRIADLLKTSGHAVENDKRRIYRKLDVTGQSHAVARAAALGILGRPPSHAYPDPEPVLPVVRLRGLSSDANQAAAVAMLTAGISFCIENGMSSHQSSWWNAWHGGPQLMVVVEPTTADPSMCANARLPVVLVEPGPARQAGMSGPPHRGAVPVISIDRVAEDLVPAIQLAAREFDRRDTGGGAWVGREVGGPEPESHHDHLPELTARESDILRSIACGHTVRQTARWLGIAAKTVENTQARLFRKLGARNRAGALAIAHGIGLVDPAEPDPPPAGLATRREVRQPTHAGQH